LIATDTFSPRKEGITTFLLKIIPELKTEFKVKVLAPDYHKIQSTDEVIRLPCFHMQIGDSIPPKFSFRKIWSHVKETDIVFVQSLAPIGVSAIIAGLLQKKKVIVYLHIIEWELMQRGLKHPIFKSVASRFFKQATRFLYNRCELLIAPSGGVAKIYEHNKIKTKKVVVHMGIDTNYFVPCKNKAESKVEIGIEPNRPVIGYVGRLSREKDLATLSRAFSRVKKHYKDCVLLIVGDGIDDIKKIFKNKTDVMMVGETSNVPKYLQAMDVFVLCSLTETSSLSTMEAMSCKVPVIVTRVGYVKNYVVDGFNGYFFDKKDSYSLTKKLEKLLGNPRLRKKIGDNCRKTVQDYFPWKKTSENIKKILRSY